MSLDPSNVYRGIWTNHIHGEIVGRTITLTVGKSFYLNAFVQLVIAYAGGCLWSILNLIIFMCYARHSRPTGYRLQLQAIRANAVTGLSSFNKLVALLCCYGRVKGPKANKYPRDPGIWVDLACAFIIVLGTTATAIFANNLIAANHNEVLYSGPICGLWSVPLNVTANTTIIEYARSRVLNDTNRAASYVRECYSYSSTSPSCNVFVVPKITWTEDRQGDCPYSNDICSHSSLVLDTGYIHSDSILGINSEPKDRIYFRRVTSCAPLNITNYYTETSDGYFYSLGPLSDGSSDSLFGENLTAFVFKASRFSGSIYGLAAKFHMPGAPLNIWDPIDDLQRDDADITLFGLYSNAIQYSEPVYDPFFEATEAISSPYGEAAYIASGPTQLVHFLACTDQFQFHDSQQNESNPTTALNGWYVLEDIIRNASWSSSNQQAIALRVQKALWSSSLSASTQSRDASSLLAYAKAYGFSSPGLPDDQWILEMLNLFGISLARFQRELITYVAGPPQQSGVPMFLDAPAPENRELICQGQKVMNTGTFVNFGFAKLFGVLSGCVAIILLSYCSELMVQRLKGRDQLKALKLLQMQRQLLDATGDSSARSYSLHPIVVDGITHWELNRTDFSWIRHQTNTPASSTGTASDTSSSPPSRTASPLLPSPQPAGVAGNPSTTPSNVPSQVPLLDEVPVNTQQAHDSMTNSTIPHPIFHLNSADGSQTRFTDQLHARDHTRPSDASREQHGSSGPGSTSGHSAQVTPQETI